MPAHVATHGLDQAAPARSGAAAGGDPGLWRRRLRHDIRHELGTIIMLASAVAVADDVGATSRERVEQLLGETRWLDHLLRRLDGDDAGGTGGTGGAGEHERPLPERIRVDDLTAEVVTGMRLATPHEVSLTGGEAWAHMDPVALWRALRNVLDNACRVAAGRVDVQVAADRGWVAVQVDDDGPGFGAGSGGLASLGLGIVHDLISEYGGGLEIRTGAMGGARVRILLPSAPPPEAVPAAVTADDWRPHP
ncbi:ATP-binding protein [Spirillospora sp. NPDC029432]|uniref:sensor histidine kinase n=1 Tax=Spirillospora sp. NPDC029432 TaxID=3154599 RepID=UPI003453820E